MNAPKILTAGVTRRQTLAAAAALPLFSILPRRANAAEFNYKFATGQDPSHPVNKRAQEAIDRILDVNLRGTLYMSQAVLPAMQAQQSGSIICISSVSAQRGGGILGGPHYSAAKAGVLGLARAMAREFGPENIRVNSITPGLIGTDIIKGKLTEEKKAEIAETIPLARLGRADDIGGACVFLASDLSLYCTGITLDVNGGMLIH